MLRGLRSTRSILCLLALAYPSILAATWQDEVGLTQLQTELGGSTPTGAGVGVSQFEVPEAGSGISPGAYSPNPGFSEFTHVTFTYKSGTPSTYSTHATNVVGAFLYGSTSSVAPGIGTVDSWSVNHWVPNSMHFGVSDRSPDVESRRIQNHSWIASTGDNPSDQQILRRFDYMIDRDKVLSVVGVNNDNSEAGGGTDQNLLSTSYHAVRVGRTDGKHMSGTTAIDGTGRQRIDVVAPAIYTSRATACVSGATSLLYQTINNTPTLAAADDPRVVKAILLTGATKLPSMNWSNSPSAPLDAHYGTGQINVLNNHHILATGRQQASDSADVGTRGWDTASASSSSTKRYFFNVATSSDLSSTLVWHRVIAPQTVPNLNWNNPTSNLSTLNLRLSNATGYTVGSMIAESTSPIESHQYLWKTSLPAGRYVIEVSNSSGSTTYGLAFDSRPYTASPLRLVNNPLRLKVAFERIADPSLTYGIWASSDLLNWGTSPIWSSTGSANTAGTVNVEDTVDISANPKRFLQLRASGP